ncbi:TVP38/TMEM64 family protein [Candidatus Entotheonella palauensis]|uniref:TVP38/TMEM64 family protein n=1 Tax=Candidatus Entotheonella palauensis TaxID=93172 RepID=UPI000B7F9716|nr:VTT domain-containing protein [Candidatus Entotheonella palauensis]
MGFTHHFEIMKSPPFRWMLLSGILVAVIVLPFLVLAQPIEAWFQQWLQSATEQEGLTALILITLLASDVLLPIPSSLVSTTAGALHGLWPGALVSTSGMTLSCAIGYWLGASAGRRVATRLIGSENLRRCEDLHQRGGDWMIVVARSIPVLAEASTFYAGMGRMRLKRFMGLSALSNLGISLVYAAVGVSSVQLASFWLAFGAAIVCPVMAMFIVSKLYPVLQQRIH